VRSLEIWLNSSVLARASCILLEEHSRGTQEMASRAHCAWRVARYLLVGGVCGVVCAGVATTSMRVPPLQIVTSSL